MMPMLSLIFHCEAREHLITVLSFFSERLESHLKVMNEKEVYPRATRDVFKDTLGLVPMWPQI